MVRKYWPGCSTCSVCPTHAQIICADAEALGNILARARSLRGVIETETMLELEVHKFSYSHAGAR